MKYIGTKHYRRYPKITRNDSDQWLWALDLGKLQLRLTVHRHRSKTVGDRWVYSPTLIWDRNNQKL